MFELLSLLAVLVIIKTLSSVNRIAKKVDGLSDSLKTLEVFLIDKRGSESAEDTARRSSHPAPEGSQAGDWTQSRESGASDHDPLSPQAEYDKSTTVSRHAETEPTASSYEYVTAKKGTGQRPEEQAEDGATTKEEFQPLTGNYAGVEKEPRSGEPLVSDMGALHTTGASATTHSGEAPVDGSPPMQPALDTVKILEQWQQTSEAAKLDTPLRTSFDKPKLPAFLQTAFDAALDFVRAGNIWVAGGVLMLLAGFAFLMTYMVEQGVFSVEVRIALAAVTGMAMVGFGLRLRTDRPTYALILQGGGIGVLYLSAFAAAKFSTILPPIAALAVMTLMIVPAVALAMLQRAEIMAVFGFLGGYAAPILLSSGSGDYVSLFSYYTLLNITLLGICRFRLWRWLNLLGGTCTFAIMGAWILRSYQPEMFSKVEVFLLGNVLIFILMTLSSAQKKEFSFNRSADTILALGMPFVAAIFQWRIARELPHGLSMSALFLGIFFLGLALLVWKRWGRDLQRLAEFYLINGVVLANLALPLEVSNSLSSGVWAVEGAILFYFACRQSAGRLKVTALLIQAAAFALLIKEISGLGPEDHTLLGTSMLAVSALVSAVFQKKYALKPYDENAVDSERASDSIEDFFVEIRLDSMLMNICLGYWYSGLAFEAWRFANDPVMSFFFTASLSSAVFFLLGGFLRHTEFSRAIFVIAPISLVALLSSLWFISMPAFILPIATGSLSVLLTHQFLTGMEGMAWIAFAFSLAVFFILNRKTMPKRLSAWLATITILELLLVLTSSCRSLALDAGLTRAWIGFAGLLPSLLYICALLLPKTKSRMDSHWGTVLFGRVPLVMFICIGIWFVVGMFKTGGSAPLPVYIPLLNPLELRQALSIALFLVWQKQLRDFTDAPPVIPWRTIAIGLDILVFVWLHSIIARTTYFYTGWQHGEIWGASMFQIMLTALWGLYGMTHIILGNKLKIRALWIAGTTLMALDTTKLLLLDLADKGTLLRVVSFFIVGGIFLLIGFLAPLPPKQKTVTEKSDVPETEAF